MNTRQGPNPVTEAIISPLLKTERFGRKIHYFPSLDSTNTMASTLAEDGAVEGTLVIVDEQTKGKGRRGRSWYSPPGLGIWMSLILRPAIAPRLAPGLSIVTGLSLAETIREVMNLEAQVKWPNDCLIKGAKVAGILTELSGDREQVNYIVLGVGLNVNQQIFDFPVELQKTATSLAIESESVIPRADFLSKFLLKLETRYDSFLRDGVAPFIDPYTRMCSLIGREVTAEIGKKTITGMATKIDPGGALVIESEGQEVALTAGEVVHVR